MLKNRMQGVNRRGRPVDNAFAMTNNLLQMEPKPMIKTSAFERFNNVLKDMIEKGGSDLHVTVGSGFRIRMLGELVPASDTDPLTPGEIASLAGAILIAGRKCTRENVMEFVEALTDYDCSYSLQGHGRFRVNISSQRRSLALVLRHIPYVLPTIEDLNLPPVLGEIALADRGLVLVTGITGSGKSTTLAAMINLINRKRRCKIITIEDPIEFLYRDALASIAQRECGSDTESFAKALRAALRQDPDIILVGEMRDRETIDIAIKAAETGHLVLSTVHTTDAPRTINRILSVFDPSEQAAARLRLSETLLGIVSQRLLQKADRSGRVAACEIMRHTTTIQECIADPDKIHMMKEYIEKGREHYGMQTFDQHLTDLYRAGTISLETAKSAATSASDFERNLQFE
jgi:twitching motility protein PilT